MRQLLGDLYQSGKWVLLHNKQAPGSPNATKADLLSKCRLAGSQGSSPPKDEQGVLTVSPAALPGSCQVSRLPHWRSEGPRAGGVLWRPYSDAKIRGLEPLQERQALTFTFDEGALKKCEGQLFFHGYRNVFGNNRPRTVEAEWKSTMERSCLQTWSSPESRAVSPGITA